MTSRLPAPLGANATQESHSPHGVGVGPCSQLSDRARMRALEVLPQPRGPLNRYAWWIRPVRSACISGSVTCSCPPTSANVAGRYFRYSARLTDHLLWARPREVLQRLDCWNSTRYGAAGTSTEEEAPLPTGTPRAPARARLPLLPSGPGGVGRGNAARGVDATLAAMPTAYRRRPRTMSANAFLESVNAVRTSGVEVSNGSSPRGDSEIRCSPSASCRQSPPQR